MHTPEQLHEGARVPHYLSDEPLPFGKILFGQVDYHEFICSKSTAKWLKEGGMTHLDGRPVTLTEKDELRGGKNVILGFWFNGEPT
jgi:hypothetical protein